MFFNFTILSFGIEILEFYRRDDRNEYAFDGFLTSERFVIEPLPFVRPKKSTRLGFFNIITRVYCLGRVASPLTTLPDAFESGEMSPVYTQTTEIPGASRQNACQPSRDNEHTVRIRLPQIKPDYRFLNRTQFFFFENVMQHSFFDRKARYFDVC